MSTVDCAEETKMRLLKALDKHLISGSSHDQMERAFCNVLSGTEWSWRWLEEWKIRFSQEGRLPYMWDSLKVSKRNAAGLLVHSMVMRIGELSRAGNFESLLQRSPDDWILRFALLGCAVEQSVAESTGGPSLDGLPPFFPGDRTRLRCSRNSG
ncbi:hypothetical protein [Jeongeupia chitinilytica]|nr:hypothetical protein [Jeongeupia chitinilytica]